MYDEETIDWDAVAPDNLDEELPSTSVDGKISFKDPEKGTGVVYLASIPPMFTPNKIRDAFSIFGEVGRVFLQVRLASSTSRFSYIFSLISTRARDEGSLKAGSSSRRNPLPRKSSLG